MREVDRKFLQKLGKDKLSDLSLTELGQLNEKRVEEYYEKQGFKVLDINKLGFPDFIVVLDKSVFKKIKFVEVKGGKHEVHWHQSQKLFELSEIGAEVKIGHVIDHLDEKKWRIVEEVPPLQETLMKTKA